MAARNRQVNNCLTGATVPKQPGRSSGTPCVTLVSSRRSWRRQPLPRACSGLADPVDHVVGVAEPDEDRLVGTGGHGDPLGEHRTEERGERRLVGRLGVVEVPHRIRCLITADDAEQRPDDRKASRKARAGAGIAHQRRKVAGPCQQFDVHVRGELVERGQPCRGRQRVARQGARVEDRPER